MKGLIKEKYKLVHILKNDDVYLEMVETNLKSMLKKDVSEFTYSQLSVYGGEIKELKSEISRVKKAIEKNEKRLSELDRLLS